MRSLRAAVSHYGCCSRPICTVLKRGLPALFSFLLWRSALVCGAEPARPLKLSIPSGGTPGRAITFRTSTSWAQRQVQGGRRSTSHLRLRSCSSHSPDDAHSSRMPEQPPSGSDGRVDPLAVLPMMEIPRFHRKRMSRLCLSLSERDQIQHLWPIRKVVVVIFSVLGVSAGVTLLV